MQPADFEEQNMLTELSARLSETIEQKRLKAKYTGDLRAVEAELREQSARLGTLETQLEKEQVDVRKLERASLSALFHAVLGDREARLEKERQEFLAAQLRYQQTKRQVEFLERERDYLHGRLVKLAAVDTEYEALLSEKEGLLRQADQAAAGELVENAEQIATLTSETKDLSEAVRAGKQVISSLERVLEALESAKSWGALDMLGGGLISTAVKHNRIDEARDGIHDVQTRMSRFQRELADVRARVELDIDIGEFETFADFFFDGLIFDWVVQSRINASLERTRQVHSLIARTLEELAGLESDAVNRLAALQEVRAQIITRA